MRQVVDSSAILAFVLDEAGSDAVTANEGPFCLSSVNLTEILTKVLDRNLSPTDVATVLRSLPIEHFDFTRSDAAEAAALRPATRRAGLSLGDRACLALAKRLDLPVLTADTLWSPLDLGIDIRLIR